MVLVNIFAPFQIRWPTIFFICFTIDDPTDYGIFKDFVDEKDLINKTTVWYKLENLSFFKSLSFE